MYNPVFKKFVENSQVEGFSVDVDENPKITGQYGVRSVPTTILVDETGKEHGRVMGSVSETELYNLISK